MEHQFLMVSEFITFFLPYFISLNILVKPYIPYDMVPSDYTLPMAIKSDGTPLPATKLKVPNWVVDSDIIMQKVTYSEDAMRGIEEAVLEKRLKHYSSVEEVVEFITQVIVAYFNVICS
jgi:hypothetical protein